MLYNFYYQGGTVDVLNFLSSAFQFYNKIISVWITIFAMCMAAGLWNVNI